MSSRLLLTYCSQLVHVEPSGLGKTFKELFAEIEPLRRARIVLGMDKMHRRRLEAARGQAHIPYDASEYLTDEPTIIAYLTLVQQLGDPAWYALARSDATRARNRRFSEEQLERQQIPQTEKPQDNVIIGGRKYYVPQLTTAPWSSSGIQSAARVFPPRRGNHRDKTQRRDWALERLSKGSLS